MKKLLLFSIGLLVLTACSLQDPTTSDPPASSSVTRSRPLLGNAGAPVLIEEFSDLQCPACAFISPQVEQVVKENPELARMHYYHFPLPQHEHAFAAAEASECAADQGKFWEYVDLTFKNQDQLGQDTFFAIAKELALDEVRFKACLSGGSKKAIVTADLREGRARRVNATPTLFVNGQKVQFTSAETFKKYLESVASE